MSVLINVERLENQTIQNNPKKCLTKYVRLIVV